MSVIGVDIGTTSICALVMDRDGVTALEKRENRFSDPELYSQDPGAIVNTVRSLVDGLWDGGVTDIAISSQMHGVLFTDDSGRAVSDFYTWKNPWGDRPFADSTVAAYLAAQTGRRTLSGYGVSTAFFLSQSGGLPAGGTCLCSIGDYAAMDLTGTSRPVMNVTMAESVGCFDAKRRDFDRAAIRKLGLPETLFPAVSVSDRVCGTYRGARVHAPFGDNQCSFLGSVEDYRTDVCINVGTGQQVSCFSERYVEPGRAEVRSFFDRGWLYVGVSQNGGKVYERLIRMIESLVRLYAGTEVDGYGRTRELWRGAGRDRPVPTVTPALYDAVGGHQAGTLQLRDLREEQDGLDLVIGYVSGMAEELAGLYEAIPASVRMDKRRFFGAGNGFVRNQILWELTEERLHTKIERERWEEAAAAGAARYVLAENR